MEQCPVCGKSGATRLSTTGDMAGWDCRRCGQFYLAGTADVVLRRLIQGGAINASRFSHALRVHFDQHGQARNWVESELAPFKEDLTQISPQEQFHKLILWIGQNQSAAYSWASSTPAALAARIGATIYRERDDEPGIAWLVKAFGNSKFLWRDQGSGGTVEFQLTADGWNYFDELSRRVVNSHNAFMAMKYGGADMERVLTTCFQPAAQRAGFELKALNEHPSAGLIDNQIRAAIRASRFVVADLTDDNNGAYFEAGFAEGLGIPVIYTCEATKFKAHKTHFDTNHMTTVVWDLGTLDKAGTDLTATIRNTFPADAKFED